MKPTINTCAARTGDILARLGAYVDVETDSGLTDPLDLVSALFQRINLERDLKAIEESGSWDYCKQAARDSKMRIRRWLPIHEDAAIYQRDCVPPLLMRSGIMMVGEAYSGDFHLTTYHRQSDDTYWCCLLTRHMVNQAAFIHTIPFAEELPMMGIPEPKKIADE